MQIIYQMWISYFGEFLSDNRGEFLNEKDRKLNKKLNIETLITAGELPFSNWIVEQHNQKLAETIL